MATLLKRERSFVDVCLEMLHDDASCNLSLAVPGSGEPPISVHQAFVCQLGPLVRDCLLTIAPDVEVVVLFPEFSLDEVKTLISFLYRGQEGRISQSLARAMGLTVGGHGYKGLVRSNSRRPQAVAAAAAIAASYAFGGSDEDDKKETKKRLASVGGGDSGNGPEPGKFEADIKLELADYEEEEENNCNGGMSGGGGHLKLFQPKCELGEEQAPLQQHWHWNKVVEAAAAAAASGNRLIGRKKRRSRSAAAATAAGMVKQEEVDWEEEEAVKRRKRKKRQRAAGANCVSPKSKIVEYYQVPKQSQCFHYRYWYRYPSLIQPSKITGTSIYRSLS
jgi:hypothetical protein